MPIHLRRKRFVTPKKPTEIAVNMRQGQMKALTGVSDYPSIDLFWADGVVPNRMSAALEYDKNKKTTRVLT